MADRPPATHPSLPERPTLTSHELQVAILFAKGMSTEAIHQKVLVVSKRKVDFTVYQIDKKMCSPLNVPPGSLRPRMYDWLSEHGLLPVEGELEAILSPTISALENWL